jgi:hypothetical protein
MGFWTIKVCKETFERAIGLRKDLEVTNVKKVLNENGEFYEIEYSERKS